MRQSAILISSASLAIAWPAYLQSDARKNKAVALDASDIIDSVFDLASTPDSGEVDLQPAEAPDGTQPEFEIITTPDAVEPVVEPIFKPDVEPDVESDIAGSPTGDNPDFNLETTSSQGLFEQLIDDQPTFDRPAPPNVTEADIEMFDYMANHAAAVYCNTDATRFGQGIFCSVGGTDINACPMLKGHHTSIIGLFDAGWSEIRAYTAVDHTAKEIVLSITGSNGPHIWAGISNATIVEWPIVPEAMAHQSFIRAWNVMNPEEVALTLTRANKLYPDYSIKATGHSLGGAIATLAAAQLRLEHDLPIDLYTFGAPMVGNWQFSHFINEQEEGKNFRITNYNDPMPSRPGPCNGYTHIDNEYWLAGSLPTGDTYPVDSVKVCQGFNSLKCNGGTGGGTWANHYTYFGDIGACRPASEITALLPSIN